MGHDVEITVGIVGIVGVVGIVGKGSFSGPFRGHRAADDLRTLAPSGMILTEQVFVETYAAAGGRRF